MPEEGKNLPYFSMVKESLFKNIMWFYVFYFPSTRKINKISALGISLAYPQYSYKKDSYKKMCSNQPLDTFMDYSGAVIVCYHVL